MMMLEKNSDDIARVMEQWIARQLGNERGGQGKKKYAGVSRSCTASATSKNLDAHGAGPRRDERSRSRYGFTLSNARPKPSSGSDISTGFLSGPCTVTLRSLPVRMDATRTCR